MNYLCIDTSASKIALALKAGVETYYYIGEVDCKKHNSILLKSIDELLNKGNVTLNDIDVFGVVVGPGSFTGIRIGVATVNAFALALNKRIVQITSLEQLDDGSDKTILLDCKHGNYYALTVKDGINSYLPLTEEEISDLASDKEYLTQVYPERMMEKCIEQAEEGLFVAQAKPFYMKRSSAERETGILC